MAFRHNTPVRVQADMEDATRVLTGPASGSVWALTNCAADALVLTGGGLGGCRSVLAMAGAAGEVILTYSDRSISNWGTQEPTNQTRAEPDELYRAYGEDTRLQVKKQQKQEQLNGEWTQNMMTKKLLEAKTRRNKLEEHGDHRPNSV